MFIPIFVVHREVCQPDQPDCLDGVVPPDDGSSSADTEDPEHNIGPVYSTAGAHRFIGVASVATLILLVCLLWVAFGAWPRRKIRLLLHGESTVCSTQEGGKKAAGGERKEPRLNQIQSEQSIEKVGHSRFIKDLA